MSTDSPLVRMFSTEYSKEYYFLIKNGFKVDDRFVRERFNIPKEKSTVKKLFDWIISTFNYIVCLKELAVTQKTLFDYKHILSKEKIADFEKRIEELKIELNSK